MRRWGVFLPLLLLPALAQAPGLTQEEARILDRLVEEALPRDPGYLRALADLEASRQTLGILGAVSAEVGASLAGEYGQVAPSYRLAVSLNLAELFRDRSPALKALEAQVEAREAELKAQQARARVGGATPAEVLAAAERLSQARLALYRANLDLALALEDLARAVGLPLDALRALLRPLEAQGGTSVAPPGPRGP